ncbi:uncharacterized protein LOC110100419 [Dendrobium catenatum]|uniref:Uncharacterized protein n=1 Tax=Dendrobium catenatum TaxID=906689 RepID=A0A2I0X3X8_9ASPA|nr:uncharacterized protein LOC110100419 [Dendrobium catenatum]PKU82616.1 hypothetical protein MA16_Dca022784 [Dendrobium catenatum]
MPQRGYVLIFIFWALLAIITPTLVIWSASEKSNLAPKEEGSRVMVARRMIRSTDKGCLKTNKTEDEGMQGPTPSPMPVRGNEKLS